MMTANADKKAVRRELLNIIGFSRKSIDLMLSNTHVGLPEELNVRHRYQSSCGDMIELGLVISGDIITEAGFNYSGCAGLHAAAVGMADLIGGMTIAEAVQIDESDIISHLEGLPENRRVCAEWARDALRQTLDTYMTQLHEDSST